MRHTNSTNSGTRQTGTLTTANVMSHTCGGIKMREEGRDNVYKGKLDNTDNAIDWS